jgi:hypothetical protein
MATDSGIPERNARWRSSPCCPPLGNRYFFPTLFVSTAALKASPIRAMKFSKPFKNGNPFQSDVALRELRYAICVIAITFPREFDRRLLNLEKDEVSQARRKIKTEA